ncbi:MAG: hypothetical protein R6V85_14050 [Polyangia bacterium]
MRGTRKTAVAVPLAAVLSAALGAAGCAPSHAGRTVGRGTLQLEGALGGPLLRNLGPALPVPNLPVGARWGATDRVDLSLHTNPLPLIVGGFATLDAGATWALLGQDGGRGLEMAASTGMLLVTDFQTDARIAPLVDFAAGWALEHVRPFAGVQLAADLWGGGLMINPHLGAEFEMGRRAALSLTGVWFHAGFDTADSTVEWVSPGGRGALGLLVGLKLRFETRGGEGD